MSSVHTLPDPLFHQIPIIGLTLLWGFGINILMCVFFTETFLKLNFTLVVIFYFIVAFTGIFLSTKSDNPIISFIGYNLVVLPVGVVLSIGIADYEQISVINALITTTAVTLVMMLLGTIFPYFFLSLKKVLFLSLTCVVIIELILLFIGINTPTLWDFLVALLFCGYIGYDWCEAQNKVYTLDNAIDSVVGLYLDIINLFIRILSVTGKSKKD